MRRWTFVAIAAVAGGLAIAGIASLVLSVHLGGRPAAAHEAGRVQAPPPSTDAPPAASASAALARPALASIGRHMTARKRGPASVSPASPAIGVW